VGKDDEKKRPGRRSAGVRWPAGGAEAGALGVGTVLGGGCGGGVGDIGEGDGAGGRWGGHWRMWPAGGGGCGGGGLGKWVRCGHGGICVECARVGGCVILGGWARMNLLADRRTAGMVTTVFTVHTPMTAAH